MFDKPTNRSRDQKLFPQFDLSTIFSCKKSKVVL